MIEITTDTMEEKIIKTVQKNYPITIAELSDHLHMSRHKIRFELLKLQSRGLIELEPIQEKTFIRLLRTDIRFVGCRHQETFLKRRRQKYKPADDQVNDIMYR